MEAKKRIYTALKYLWCFIFCTICFCLIFCFWNILGYDHFYDYTDCFELQNGYITREVLFDGNHVYCNYQQVCACVSNNTYIIAFYILALPVIVIYELFRRKIIYKQYRFFCVLIDIFVWSSFYYLILNSNFNWIVRIEYTYKFIAPMAIIMLLLNCLSSKDFKVISTIVGTIYGLLIGIFIVLNISNFFINYTP